LSAEADTGLSGCYRWPLWSIRLGILIVPLGWAGRQQLFLP